VAAASKLEYMWRDGEQAGLRQWKSSTCTEFAMRS
jgi:hypothetical protein